MNETLTVVVPVVVALPIVGAPGTVVGEVVVTELDADDTRDWPRALKVLGGE